MRIGRSVLWAVVLLANLSSLPAFAEEQGRAGARPLRVVADNNYPPYLYVDRSGRAEGYLIDLWRLWEKKTGVAVDLQPMQWSDALRAMQERRADVIDTIYRTPPREALYDFSEPYATMTVSIYVDPSISGLHDAASLAGFVIGVQRGDACVDKLAGHGLTTLRLYPNYQAILAAVEAAEVKVFCMDDIPANYYLYLRQNQHRFAKAFTLYSAEFHWAVNKGDAATLALVSRGMAAITPEERGELERKWFAQPVEFRPYGKILAILALGAGLVLAVALLWIRSLRRAVQARLGEIRDKNQQLERAAEALLADQAQLRAIFEASPDAMALKDRARVYVHCNRGFEELVGLPRDAIIGRTDDVLYEDKDFVAYIREKDEQVLQGALAMRSDEVVATLNGVARHLEVIKVPIRGSGGQVSGVLVVSRDITARRRAEHELRVAAVAFESQDGMLITDEAGLIERVNVAFTRLTGFGAAEACGRSPAILQSGLHPPQFYQEMWDTLTTTGYWKGEVANRRQDGSLYTARLSITAVVDAQGKTRHYIGNLQDVSAEKEAHALAERLASFDSLTGLPNRASLTRRIAGNGDGAATPHEFSAIMMLDLDHFQKVNDSLGHVVGDQLLVEVTRRLHGIQREGDTLGRFSGDGFVLLCEGLGGDRAMAATRAMAIAEAARHALTEPVLLEGQRVSCSGSIGVTLFRGQERDAHALLGQAELAMYKSKKEGRDRVCFFEASMQAALNERNWLERALRDALEQQQFVLYYQVQVDVHGRPTGAEALLRWQHPERGMIAPAAFIPLAEETGQIVRIGRWVLASACRQLAVWAADPALRELSLAVNISPRQFKSDSFVDEVLDELAHAGVPPGRLELEITESLAIDDFTSSISKLNILKTHGFRISLDDFGTGNSSLNYLTKLPLAQLKIDKSFVDELPASHRDAMVAQTIIAMGQGLGLEVIAEGVEQPAQRDFLAAHGCHAFQGYLFGRPVPVQEFEAMVRGLLATVTP